MPRELRVFISSPGDVPLHRETVEHVIEGLNHDPLVAPRCRLSAISWSRKGAAIPMSANQTSQWSISEYLPSPGDCDLTIVLFWSRLGTPLPPSIRRPDGSAYPSGTVWELEHALAAGKPVWIYRKTAALPAVDADDPVRRQAASLDAYLARANNADGSINFGINRFADDGDLRIQLGQQLRWFVGARLDGSDAAARPGPAPAALHALCRYPIGPMLRDILVPHLPDAVAELLVDRDVKGLFSQVNHALAACRAATEPELKLTYVMFPSEKGPAMFWTAAFHGAALHGPRVLAALLWQFSPDQFEGRAREDYLGLMERVNRYA